MRNGENTTVGIILVALCQLRHSHHRIQKQKGEIKIECRTCHTKMIRSIKSSNHDVINVYAPKGEVHI